MTAYPEAPGHKSSGTSKVAASETKSRAATLRERALEILKLCPAGLTADEVAEIMGESILSIRPRISELAALGRVEKSGERRENASGLNAWVWQAKVREGVA